MQKLTIIILVLIFNLTFGQETKDPTELLISEFKAEMEKEGVSDFFVLKQITYGTFRIVDLKDPNSCNEKGYYFTMYGFWERGNDTWIKKYDNCGGFNSIKLTDSKPIEFYKKNIDNLKKEKVEIYTNKSDSIINGKEYKFFSTQSHSPLRYFWFYKGSNEFKKNFDKYDLKTKKDNKNINYESNNNLSIVKLNSICEEIIYELEKKKLFNRLK